MSEEYTQSKAFLDALSRLRNPIGRYEPVDAAFARLKAELEEAKVEAGKLAKIAGEANTARYAAIAERDSAVNRCKVQAETITFLQGETDKLRAELEEAQGDWNKIRAERDKAVCDLMDRNNELMEARLDVSNKSKVNEVLLKQRDEAKDSAKFWEDRFDVCAGQLRGVEIERNAAIAERDQAVTQGNSLADAANAYRLERNEARLELAKLQDRKPVRLLAHYNCTDCTPQHTATGRLEALEARLAKLERLSTAR